MKREELLDLITVGEAAKLRGTTHQAILDLIRRDRLQAVELGGKRFLRRTEVLKFKPRKSGRPSQMATTRKAAKKGKKR